MSGQGYYLTYECSCPSRSDKDAHEIARTWISDGVQSARSMFDKVARRQHLKVFEAMMLAEKISYRKTQLERSVVEIPPIDSGSKKAIISVPDILVDKDYTDRVRGVSGAAS